MNPPVEVVLLSGRVMQWFEQQTARTKFVPQERNTPGTA